MSEQLDQIAPDTLNNNKKLSFLVATINHGLRRYDYGGSPSVETREAIAEKLDALCSIVEVDCVFSGPCEVLENGEATPSLSTWVEEEYGVCEGFWVHPFGKGKSTFWRVALGFFDTGVDITESSYRYLLNTAAPRYGVTPFDELESAFPEYIDSQSLQGVLRMKSDDIMTMLNDPAFLTLSAAEQCHLIDAGIISGAEACQPFGGVADKHVGIDAERAYIVINTDEGLDYEKKVVAECSIKGTCEGIVVLPRMRLGFGTPIRTVDELVDSAAGLCLAVRVDDETATTHALDAGERIYIPISGQSVEATFSVAAINAM